MEIHNYTSRNEKLMDCPFCGEKPVWYLKGNSDVVGHKRIVVVRCPSCGAIQETAVLRLPTKWACTEAIAKWNMRTTDKPKMED